MSVRVRRLRLLDMVLAMEAREYPNTQVKAGRLMATRDGPRPMHSIPGCVYRELWVARPRLFRSSRTVYIFISLSMSVVLLKFPLVAIFVWVARPRLFRSSRTVFIFISLSMSVVLLKFPLVAIFVWVARATPFPKLAPALHRSRAYVVNQGTISWFIH